MLKLKTMIVAGGVAAAAVAGMAITTPALADPPSGTTPAATDIVGTGSDTIQLVTDQLATDYNKTSVAPPNLYSFDAVNPTTLGAGDSITEKQGCASRPRPNGSGAGIAELEANLRPAGDTTDYCVDYARSSRARQTTAPADPTSIIFIEAAGDAVTYAATKTTNTPGTLTTKQLQAIYSCDASLLGGNQTGPVTEDEIGGKGTNPVVPVIPQSSSGTRKFFLASIGVTTLGSCVVGQDNTVEENEGTNNVFASSSAPDIIFPYSIAVYLAQSQYKHDAGRQGNLVLQGVNGTAPTTGKSPRLKINPKFPYSRKVYYVVRNASTTGGKIVPGYLQSVFGNGATKSNPGFICSKQGQADFVNYGFAKDNTCGKLS